MCFKTQPTLVAELSIIAVPLSGLLNLHQQSLGRILATAKDEGHYPRPDYGDHITRVYAYRERYAYTRIHTQTCIHIYICMFFIYLYKIHTIHSTEYIVYKRHHAI